MLELGVCVWIEERLFLQGLVFSSDGDGGGRRFPTMLSVFSKGIHTISIRSKDDRVRDFAVLDCGCEGLLQGSGGGGHCIRFSFLSSLGYMVGR
jgi:hypothetical protein